MPTRRFTISLPEDLAGEVLAELGGPRSPSGRPPYGRLSRLVAALLSRWLAERRAARKSGAAPDWLAAATPQQEESQ